MWAVCNLDLSVGRNLGGYVSVAAPPAMRERIWARISPGCGLGLGLIVGLWAIKTLGHVLTKGKKLAKNLDTHLTEMKGKLYPVTFV